MYARPTHARDLVKKVAVYKDRVAVQLPSRVVLYQLDPEASAGGSNELNMQYRVASKIAKQLECSLLVVTAHHIVLCQVRGCCCGAFVCVFWGGGERCPFNRPANNSRTTASLPLPVAVAGWW